MGDVLFLAIASEPCHATLVVLFILDSYVIKVQDVCSMYLTQSLVIVVIVRCYIVFFVNSSVSMETDPCINNNSKLLLLFTDHRWTTSRSFFYIVCMPFPLQISWGHFFNLHATLIFIQHGDGCGSWAERNSPPIFIIFAIEWPEMGKI